LPSKIDAEFLWPCAPGGDTLRWKNGSPLQAKRNPPKTTAVKGETMVRRIGSFLLAVVAMLPVATMNSQAQSVSTRHVREVTFNGQAQSVGRLPATQILQLDIVLPLKDQTGLDAFLKEVYDPASPSYRHFLTVQEFTERFGPTQANYDAAIAFAKANGLAVVGGTRDGMDVQVKGSVAAIESAFHVNMRTYQHPTEKRVFYAPDREPTTTLSFQLWHISGLDNYSIPHPMFEKRSDYAKAHGIAPEAVVSHATTGSGPSGSFLGSDMRAAYYGGTALTGAGQNLGLFEYYGTDLADLTTYFTNAGQTNNVPVTLLSTDGTSTACVDSKAGGDCDDTEQTLDMTQAIGMAPGLASLVVYVGSTDTAIISAMTTHSPLPTTIGCSWGWTPADSSTLDPYFEKMAAQGQNFFAASGDDSTWSSKNEAWPADDANVVSVGGTDLVTASAAGPWKSETAWSDSGGGISPDKIAIPAWQQLSGVINSSNKGSTTYRNGPDVSANANFTFYVCADQTTCTANEYGGTSFAAPMWAAYIALVNQQSVANGDGTIGFINPSIYNIGVSSSYDTDFHDITSGTSGSYSAVTGYDLVTGWGSPNGTALISALAPAATSPTFSLSASPASVSVVQGNSGSSTITSTVVDGFDSAVTLSASGQPAGVTVSFSPASITGSGTSTLTLAVASTTATGTYTITVTGTGGGITQSTVVSLTVTAPVTGTFTISVSPTSGYLDQGQSGYAVVTTTVSGGFDSAVALSATGVPSGVTGSFSPASIAAPGSGTSDFTLTVSRTAHTGTYPITITGTGGGVTKTTTLTFQVKR
jgi:kumamolisin